MRRDMCARCSALLAVAVLALAVPGCATKSVPRWVDPDALLQVSSQGEIEAEFQRLFTGFRNASERFSTKEISAGNARFLFVTAYPYRGRAVFSIYCFEQINSDAWHLRAVLPVIEARNATPGFVADGNSVKVMIDGDNILKVASVAETIHRALNTSTPR